MCKRSVFAIEALRKDFASEYDRQDRCTSRFACRTGVRRLTGTRCGMRAWGRGAGDGGGGGRYGGGGHSRHAAHPAVVRRLCEQLNEFCSDSTATQLTFPAALTPAERMVVHAECRRLSLPSMSMGTDEHRQLTVYKNPDDVPSLPPGAWCTRSLQARQWRRT
jgi:hypothetical protein